MISQSALEVDLPGVMLFKKGKVRNVYDLSEHLLVVATDRISAFDVILPTPIPHKGEVLTALSAFWFDRMEGIVPNHFISAEVNQIIAQHPHLRPHKDILRGRSMLVCKTKVIPIECVVRGYLSGSGWKEYQKSKSVCGVQLPTGFVESQELAQPIFTPATKEESGHDINISEEEMAQRVGMEITQRLKETSIKIYTQARDYAKTRGIIIADTKFEFGLLAGEVTLIDELLTPDSSRFWPVESYKPGGAQFSFDKQFVRDYLESIRWNKAPPAPALPEEIVLKTSEKYIQALRLLSGRGLAD